MGNAQNAPQFRVLNLPPLPVNFAGAAPAVAAPAPAQAANPVVPANDHTGHPLLVFGDYDSGKSWLVKTLLKELGIVANIATGNGPANITRECQMYRAVVNGEACGFVDTEGLGRAGGATGGAVEPGVVAYHPFPLMLSVLLRVLGVIVLVTSGAASETDEMLLQLATAIVGCERKVFVVHNFANEDASPGRLTELIAMLTRPVPGKRVHIVSNATQELVSMVHGRQVRHLIYVNDREGKNGQHNVGVRKLLLQSMRHTTPLVDLENALIEINAAYVRFQFLNHYNFEFTTALGRITVEFRRLDEEELAPVEYQAAYVAQGAHRHRQDDPNLFERLTAIHGLMPADPSLTVGVLSVAGSGLDASRTRVRPLAAAQQGHVFDASVHFVEVQLHGFPVGQADGGPHSNINVWLPRPMEGAACIGQVLREGRILVYLRLRQPGLTPLPPPNHPQPNLEPLPLPQPQPDLQPLPQP